jgi:hypothetical protein
MKEIISAVPIWQKHVFLTSEPQHVGRLAYPPADHSTKAREMGPPRLTRMTNQLRHAEQGPRCDRPVTHSLQGGRGRANRRKR